MKFGNDLWISLICLFCIGINSIDLCLSNCTWVEQYSEDLYPLDAGIDSGTTYTVSAIDSMRFCKDKILDFVSGKSITDNTIRQNSCNYWYYFSDIIFS